MRISNFSRPVLFPSRIKWQDEGKMVKYFDFNKKSDLNSMTFLKAMREKKGVYTRVQ